MHSCMCALYKKNAPTHDADTADINYYAEKNHHLALSAALSNSYNLRPELGERIYYRIYSIQWYYRNQNKKSGTYMHAYGRALLMLQYP